MKTYLRQTDLASWGYKVHFPSFAIICTTWQICEAFWDQSLNNKALSQDVDACSVAFGGNLSKICGMDVQTWCLLATRQGDRPSTTGTRKGEWRKPTANFRRLLEPCIQLKCSLCLRQVSLPKDGWETFADKAQAIFLSHKPSDKHQRLIFMVLSRVLLAIKHHPEVPVAVDFHFEVHNSLQVNGNQ